MLFPFKQILTTDASLFLKWKELLGHSTQFEDILVYTRNEVPEEKDLSLLCTDLSSTVLVSGG